MELLCEKNKIALQSLTSQLLKIWFFLFLVDLHSNILQWFLHTHTFSASDGFLVVQLESVDQEVPFGIFICADLIHAWPPLDTGTRGEQICHG